MLALQMPMGTKNGYWLSCCLFIFSNSRSNCFSGYTSREKELYAQILDMIPMFGPIIEACASRTSDSEDVLSQPFETFIKLVRMASFQRI